MGVEGLIPAFGRAGWAGEMNVGFEVEGSGEVFEGFRTGGRSRRGLNAGVERADACGAARRTRKSSGKSFSPDRSVPHNRTRLHHWARGGFSMGAALAKRSMSMPLGMTIDFLMLPYVDIFSRMGWEGTIMALAKGARMPWRFQCQAGFCWRVWSDWKKSGRGWRERHGEGGAAALAWMSMDKK